MSDVPVFESRGATPRQRAEDIVRRFPGLEKHFDAAELTSFIERACAAAKANWAYEPPGTEQLRELVESHYQEP